nr:putative G-protein coupled receptor methuselah [Laodelphax striatellus]
MGAKGFFITAILLIGMSYYGLSPSHSRGEPEEFDCCNNNISWFNWPNFKCDERHNRTLSCTSQEVWFLSPTIDPDDTLNQLPSGDIIIGRWFPLAAHEYCLGTTNTTGKVGPAVITCLPDYLKEEDNNIALLAFCLIVSSFFAFLTLVVYCILPQLRDLQGKSIMCMLASMSIGYPTLGFMQLYTTELGDSACVLSALTIFFWLLATFTWLNISCFNIWQSVVLVNRKFSDQRLFFYYSLFGWGVPVLFLLAVIGFEYVFDADIKPQIGLTKCWFHRDYELWVFFYGPISVLLVANLFYFISTMFHLWRGNKAEPAMSESKLKKMKYKCMLYVRLFLTMGVTFTFEVISFLFERHVTNSWKTWWTIMDIINSLQGMILFIVLVATRKKVLRGLSTVRICGRQIFCTRSEWDNFEDEESDNEQRNNIQMGNERT